MLCPVRCLFLGISSLTLFLEAWDQNLQLLWSSSVGLEIFDKLIFFLWHSGKLWSVLFTQTFYLFSLCKEVFTIGTLLQIHMYSCLWVFFSVCTVVSAELAAGLSILKLRIAPVALRQNSDGILVKELSSHIWLQNQMNQCTSEFLQLTFLNIGNWFCYMFHRTSKFSFQTNLLLTKPGHACFVLHLFFLYEFCIKYCRVFI